MPKNTYTAQIERTSTGEFVLSINPALAEMLNVSIERHLASTCPVFATLSEEAVKRGEQLGKDLDSLAEACGAELPEDYLSMSTAYLKDTAAHVEERVPVKSDPGSPDISVVLDAVQASAFLEDARGIFFLLKSQIRDILYPMVNADSLFTDEDRDAIGRALLIEQLGYQAPEFAKPELLN